MEKVMYVAPELEVLEVMVEQGFAASPGLAGPSLPDFPDIE